MFQYVATDQMTEMCFRQRIDDLLEVTAVHFVQRRVPTSLFRSRLDDLDSPDFRGATLAFDPCRYMSGTAADIEYTVIRRGCYAGDQFGAFMTVIVGI